MTTEAIRIASTKRNQLKSIEKLTLNYCLNTLSNRFPHLAAELAQKVLLRPKKVERTDEDLKILKSARIKDIPYGNMKLTTMSWGSSKRPVVLLVHGWGGYGTQLASFIKPLLDANYRVVTFDSPGHGHSAGRSVTIAEMVNSISFMANHFGPIHGVVAHSMGALATTLVLKSGLYIPRVVFLSTSLNLIHNSIEMLKFLGLSAKSRELVFKNIEDKYQMDFNAIKDSSSLFNMKSPLLIFHDMDDKEVPYIDGQNFAKHWPGSQFVRSKGLGHLGILHSENIINKTVQFIDQSLIRK
ncbi:MAG: alpha/beta hydrolase [Bacteriovoracaceae bacterium]